MIVMMWIIKMSFDQAFYMHVIFIIFVRCGHISVNRVTFSVRSSELIVARKSMIHRKSLDLLANSGKYLPNHLRSTCYLDL